MRHVRGYGTVTASTRPASTQSRAWLSLGGSGLRHGEEGPRYGEWACSCLALAVGLCDGTDGSLMSALCSHPCPLLYGTSICYMRELRASSLDGLWKKVLLRVFPPACRSCSLLTYKYTETMSQMCQRWSPACWLRGSARSALHQAADYTLCDTLCVCVSVSV